MSFLERFSSFLKDSGYSLLRDAVHILRTLFKLDIFSALVPFDFTGFVVWPLGSVRFRILPKEFTLLCGVTGSTQQACFITGHPIDRMA